MKTYSTTQQTESRRLASYASAGSNAPPEGYWIVGRIIGVHGLRGELKIELYTDHPERFAPGITLFAGDTEHTVTVRSARPHKGHMLLTLEGVTDRTQAESMRGLWLYVAEKDAFELEEDEYWVHDILGLQVRTEEGRVLGEVVDVIFTGANDVYVVDSADPAIPSGEVLLPAIADVIRSIDLEQGVMVVHLLPGLLDE